MKILIVSQYAVPASTVGITRHFALAKPLVGRGHEVTILASSFQHWTRQETLPPDAGDVAVEVQDGVRFVWVRTPPYRRNGLARIGNMLAFARRALAADVQARLGSFDVVMGSSPPLFAAWSAARLASRLGVPFVLEVRDLWPASLVHLGRVGPRHPLVWALRRLERWLYRRATAIVSVLPDAAESIAAAGGRREAIVWIPNGVDLALLPRADAPRPPAVQEGTFTVMYAGAHNLANELDVVLAAAGLLLRSDLGDRVRFVFVGDGPEKARLREVAATMGLSNVAFEDPLPKREVYGRLAAADAYVLALQDLPLYRHGISVNKLYDYLALGRPVIFAAASSNNPVYEADAGISVLPGDPAALSGAVRALVQATPEERARMGRNGRAFIERYHDCAALAIRLERVLQEAVSASGR